MAQQGHAVTVFDAREAAREASWAGAGMLAPGGEFESVSETALLALESLGLYPDFVRELKEESGIAIDFRRCGGLEIMREGFEALHGFRSEICEYEGRPARFYPDEAIVDPRHVTHALLTACRRRGVEIREHEGVLRISEGGHTVKTTRDVYISDGVVIAAGAWSGVLYPGLPRTMPVRGHLIAWSKPPGFLEPILRHGHTYLLQRGSGILIAGSTTEHAGFDRAIDPKAAEDLRIRAVGLLPVLEAEPPREIWNGFRPGIESEGPAIGRVPGTSVWTAFGHYRNGILMAPRTAIAIAASVDQVQ